MTNPWAQRNEIGFFKAIRETVRQVLFHPAEFFSNLEIKDSTQEPLYFYFIISAVLIPLSLAITLILNVFFPPKQPLSLPLAVILCVILIPLSVLFLYIGAALMHLWVLLLKGKGGFKGTFNVLAYNISTNIFSLIPLVGGLTSGIWGVIVGVIGFKAVHNFTTLKAIIAYCLNFIIIIALLAAIAIPNFMRARLTANETLAAANLRTISVAIESYKTAQGRYPADEYDLKYAQPPYLTQSYHNKAIAGYSYSLTFRDNGYEVIAEPLRCAMTGNTSFKLATDGVILREKCK